MVHLKTATEIERIRTSCRIAADAMLAVSEELKPGVTTLYLDQVADQYIRSQNAVASVDANGHTHKSETFTLAPAPLTDQPLKILLTSDLQLKKNAPANYQKVVETVGVPDAVFFAGDLVNVPDRASEWFDNASENAPSFFPSLQGRYQQYRPGFAYNGGEILQHAPLFATIGNHEVMGRFTFDEAADDTDYSLGGAFNAPQPEWYARVAYEQVKDRVNPTGDAAIKAHWIADQSHNQQSYRELFTFPDDSPGGEDFYAIAFGDVFLISMNVSRIWRGWNVGDDQSGKFKEAVSNLDKPDAWGFGEFLFERFDKESEQYAWLEGVLESDAFKQARYKVVMAHQGVFGLGDNTLTLLGSIVIGFDGGARWEDKEAGSDSNSAFNFSSLQVGDFVEVRVVEVPATDPTAEDELVATRIERDDPDEIEVEGTVAIGDAIAGLLA